MIRTINGAIEELRKEDPKTPINSHMLRRWIASGELTPVQYQRQYCRSISTVSVRLVLQPCYAGFFLDQECASSNLP